MSVTDAGLTELQQEAVHPGRTVRVDESSFKETQVSTMSWHYKQSIRIVFFCVCVCVVRKCVCCVWECMCECEYV